MTEGGTKCWQRAFRSPRRGEHDGQRSLRLRRPRFRLELRAVAGRTVPADRRAALHHRRKRVADLLQRRGGRIVGLPPRARQGPLVRRVAALQPGWFGAAARPLPDGGDLARGCGRARRAGDAGASRRQPRRLHALPDAAAGRDRHAGGRLQHPAQGRADAAADRARARRRHAPRSGRAACPFREHARMFGTSVVGRPAPNHVEQRGRGA